MDNRQLTLYRQAKSLYRNRLVGNNSSKSILKVRDIPPPLKKILPDDVTFTINMILDLYEDVGDYPTKGKLKFKDRGNYHQFSNKYGGGKLSVDGVEWLNADVYFNVQKFVSGRGTTDQSHAFADILKKSKSPSYTNALINRRKSSKALGNGRIEDILNKYTRKNTPVRQDWDSIRLDVLKVVLFHKFYFDANLKYLLINTDDRQLIYTSRDRWMGAGDNIGENTLGTTLSDLRYIIRHLL
jgi:predicted NAD-dependent protein-ADP-ribosyltransferase YbiA (DUF1768 family)